MPSDQMYRMLIKVLRDTDASQGQEFLRRFLMGPQVSADDTAARIRSLFETDSPATVRADLLQFLKDHVGFTRELDAITSRLDETQLRKLITLAIPMWRQKGTDQGVSSMAQLLTGRVPGLDSWFIYRFILGESQLGWDGGSVDGWNIGGQSSQLDEYVSRLVVMDDGTLDEQLLLDLLQISRPSGEYIEVGVLDFLDRFVGPKDRWSSLGAAAGVVDQDAYEFVLPVGAIEQAVIPGTPAASMTEVAFQHRFMLTQVTGRHSARWNVSGASYYEVEVNTTAIIVRRYASGSLVAFQTTPASDVPRVANVWFGLRVETYRAGASYQIKVYLDGTKVHDFNDGAGWTQRPSGLFQLVNLAPSGSSDNRVDGVEVWRHPLRFATVAPSGITTTSNFIG